VSFDFDLPSEQEKLQLKSWVFIFSEFVFNFLEKIWLSLAVNLQNNVTETVSKIFTYFC